MNSYELSRNWFDWCFDNPEKIKPVHTAIYFFSIEHCNRLGWMPKFGLPTEMVKSAIGVHSYNTYIDALNDLVEWGFIKMIQKSKNQYSSNIIALSNFDKATTKALDKAMIKHSTKQGIKQDESIDSINKQLNKEQDNKETSDFDSVFDSYILMRKSIKKPATDLAIKLIKKDLNKFAPGNEDKQILILEQSIKNNWAGVFPLKQNEEPKTQSYLKEF